MFDPTPVCHHRTASVNVAQSQKQFDDDLH